MNQIVSLFMFSCGDYEKVKQDVWEENWKAMRLYSVVALVAFGVITLVSVFSLSIGKFKWVYLVYTFLSLVCFCISRCQLRSFLRKELVVYSFFAALLRMDDAGWKALEALVEALKNDPGDSSPVEK